MNRRTFLISVSLTCVSIDTKADTTSPVRRVSVILAASADDSEYPSLVEQFQTAMSDLGWNNGENVLLNLSWAGSDPTKIRRAVLDVLASKPDVIVAPGSATAGPLLELEKLIPVVFTVVPDPVGAGFVDNLANPGKNATGFASFDYQMGSKWLELLKEIAPDINRVGVARDLAVTAGQGQWDAVAAAAPNLGIDVVPIDLTDAEQIRNALEEFASAPHRGLIVTSSARSVRYRDLIVEVAAAKKLPTLYYARSFVDRGGLISYGQSRLQQFHDAALYVNRILRGEMPAKLPVQSPTKFELVINLKAAFESGRNVPESLLARADEVLE